MKTSGNRPKSAPYPRLKNSKRTSKCQFTVLENRKSKKNGPSVAVEGWPFGEKTNFRKVSQCRKTERGDPLGFLNTHSIAKYQKIEGGKRKVTIIVAFHFMKRQLIIS